MSARTPAQAYAAGRAKLTQHVNIGPGNCLENVREDFGIGPKYRSAQLAGKAAAGRGHMHPFDPKTTPLGAPLVWYGGTTIVAGQPAGHIAEYAGIVNGVPMCQTPGAPGDADAQSHYANVPVASIATGWPGHVLMGWLDELEDIPIPGATPVKPPKILRPPRVRAVLNALRKLRGARKGQAAAKAQQNINQVKKDFPGSAK